MTDQVTNNEWLRQEYERRPWAWIAEVKTNKGNWFDLENPQWQLGFKYRLKPRLPEGIQPAEWMYAYGPDQQGAAYIGSDCHPSSVFIGAITEDRWDKRSPCSRSTKAHCVVCLTDPNADELIAKYSPYAPKGERADEEVQNMKDWAGAYSRIDSYLMARIGADNFEIEEGDEEAMVRNTIRAIERLVEVETSRHRRTKITMADGTVIETSQSVTVGVV